MTTRGSTSLLPRREMLGRDLRERALVVGWAALQWPWLLRSLSGGRQADKLALLDELGLPSDSLPHLGGWKADTVFLRHIVAAVAQLRPRQVVELGCGASTLVLSRALQRHGGGRLTSYDQHADFVAATAAWLGEHGLAADLRHAPLVPDRSRWSQVWYDLSHVPPEIDLLAIDGPPWSLSPFVRGRAEALFSRIAVGGMVLLDDAARPGERVVARRWRRRWPQFSWRYDGRGTKGTLIGMRRA